MLENSWQSRVSVSTLLNFSSWSGPHSLEGGVCATQSVGICTTGACPFSREVGCWAAMFALFYRQNQMGASNFKTLVSDSDMTSWKKVFLELLFLTRFCTNRFILAKWTPHASWIAVILSGFILRSVSILYSNPITVQIFFLPLWLISLDLGCFPWSPLWTGQMSQWGAVSCAVGCSAKSLASTCPTVTSQALGVPSKHLQALPKVLSFLMKQHRTF